MRAASTVIVCETDWHRIDGEGNPSYRSCDICYESAVEDAWAGKGVEEFRRFYHEVTDGQVTLCVCERCLEGYLSEAPQ